jgi:UDPglucose 6-dehydrogenase
LGSGVGAVKICVFGLWHLGCVTAACLAEAGFQVTGLDLDKPTIDDLALGHPPLFEPGLEEMVRKGLASGNLRFTTEISDALKGQDIVWVTFDTPVDEDDHADVQFVIQKIEQTFSTLDQGSLVLISSQLPVGSTRKLEEKYSSLFPQKPVSFAYSPENLRLGKAISAFTHPDRVVAGIRNPSDKEWIVELFTPFSSQIEWMSVESAEMTKHALNAFLATSVAFINEIASLCESVGADAKEVERGLKSEPRIGPKAYLSPGGAFAGGTLARDIAFLSELGMQNEQPTHLISAVKLSNDAHKKWARGRLQYYLGDLSNKKIAVWGLTYKPGTDTLRRSSIVEMCRWLAGQGAKIQAYDPVVRQLPDELSKIIHLFPDAESALDGSEALVIGTEYPEFKMVNPDVFHIKMKTSLIIDANCFLSQLIENLPGIRYITVGKSKVNQA